MRMTFRGVWITAVAIGMSLSAATLARAEEPLNPEQLKKAYDDTLAQLKAAQERKNQLASENEKLGGQITDLQKQIDQQKQELEQLKRNDAEHAKTTWFLRSHYAAWKEFLTGQPELAARWKTYFESGILMMPRESVDNLRIGMGRDEP